MKKISTIMGFVVAAMMLLSACGAQKQVKSGIGQKKEKSEAQLYAEDPNAESIRTWAQYNGFPDDNLEQRAAVLARQEMANTVATLVTGAIENYSEDYSMQQMQSGGEGIEKRRTLSGESKEKVSSVTQELLRGSKIAVSDRYIQSDGTETAYVCVELDLETLLNNLIKNDALQQVISETEKMVLDFRSKLFSEEMKEQYEILKEEKTKYE